MLYAKLNEDTVTQYPVTQTDIRVQNSQVSLPNTELSTEQVIFLGYTLVRYSQPPAYDPKSEQLVETTPIKVGDIWEQSWQVVPLTQEEINTRYEGIKITIINSTQQRLDVFAQSRGYDSMLSACSYATSTNPKFKQEGQYCVEARDATWSVLHTMFLQVTEGTRTVPNSYEEIEPELPPLVWPPL